MRHITTPIDLETPEPSSWIQANTAAELAYEIQAREVALCDISSWTAIADYFLVMTADNARQISAIDETLIKGMDSIGAHLYRREGSADSGWLVMDFGGLVVHIFSSHTRTYYRVDALWNTHNALLTMQ
jgi:ribosome-associated protein